MSPNGCYLCLRSIHCAGPDQRRRIEFAAAYQSECAAGGRYGALRIVPAVPAPKKAKIHRGGQQSAAEKRIGFRVQGSGVEARRFPEPRTPVPSAGRLGLSEAKPRSSRRRTSRGVVPMRSGLRHQRPHRPGASPGLPLRHKSTPDDPMGPPRLGMDPVAIGHYHGHAT